MSFTLVTAFPFWYTLGCILLGFAGSALLYYKDKRLSEFAKGLRIFLFSLRAVLLAALLFLLLSPLLKSTTYKTEKPVVVIVQDNSSSVLLDKDSGFYRSDYLRSLNELASGLSQKYDVQLYSCGVGLQKLNGVFDSIKYNEKLTDLSQVFFELQNSYSNRNLGAVVLATDGIYNKGTNPFYGSEKLRTPVYTIALGDTNSKQDVLIEKIEHNRYAYLGNKFPVDITIRSTGFDGGKLKVKVTKGTDELFSQELMVKGSLYTTTIPLQLDARQPGNQRYTVSVSKLDKEFTYLNNTRDFYIDVIDGREKILILASAPSPDIAALRSAIESKETQEAEVAYVNEFSGNYKKYSLIILHGFTPQQSGAKKLADDINSSGLPLLFFGGDPTLFQTGVSLQQTNLRPNECEAFVSNAFTLFTISDELKRYFKNCPALNCPFGNYRMSTSASTLLYQRLGLVDTQNPLFVFDQRDNKKVGWFIPEGVWRWRVHDFAENNSHNLFNEFVSKAIQYLSVKEDKSLFRVYSSNTFKENELVEMNAEVYNNSYELINESDVVIDIINAEGKKYPYSFSKNGNAYKLNAGSLPIGDYSWEARVLASDKKLVQKGNFTIQAVVLEAINTTADHRLLFDIAHKTGAQMLYPNNVKKVEDLLNDREEIKTVSYAQTQFNDLVNLKWIFGLLLLTLSVEWFIRKRNGAY